MKLSALTFVTLMSITGVASAKTTYVIGDLKSIDEEKSVIFIVEGAGNVKAYNAAPGVVKKMKYYKEGDAVELKLEVLESKS